jgi:lipopolysaccharide/colanic/teichoic acid biosynthesis glycosyltransferase
MARKFFFSRTPRTSSDEGGVLAGDGFLTRPTSLLPEPLFLRALSLERKRAERSGKRFLLMLIDFGDRLDEGNHDARRTKTIAAVVARIRETDIAGWYAANGVLGVIFTELGDADERSTLPILRGRLTAALESTLSPEQAQGLRVSFHWFPDEGLPDRAEPTLYPDLTQRDAAKKVSRAIKRGIDLFGSALAVLIFLPCFLAIAAAIKLTSPGPILFRQQRLGRYGVPFTFLKFRSMHAQNDSQRHREFVKQYIEGVGKSSPAESNGRVPYKITNDPRVTPIGRFLRRTSLDELPQFLNVLRGEMSLVGPRPPIPYEIEAYDIWHRRRLMEVKPGMTGLWQVKARSKVCFDDMVRLDLEYARKWSVRLDLLILLQTPRAVLFGGGAY